MDLKNRFISLARSLQWRLVFIFITMTIFLIVPIGLMLKVRVENYSYDDFKNGIQRGYKDWEIKDSDTIEDIWNNLDRQGKKQEAIYKFWLTTDNKTYTLVDKDLKQLKTADSYLAGKSDGEILSEIMASENFISAMGNEGAGYKKKLIHSDGKAFFDCAFKKGNYILYLRYYSDGWEGMMEDFNNVIMTSLMFSLIISLILGYILSKTITVPVVNLAHKAQEVAKGDFGQLLDVKSEDEIGNLTKTFNYMAGELKNTLTEISSEKNKIETILKYMTDGIIAFNIKGEVMHTNPAACMMLGVDGISGFFNDFSSRYDLGLSLEEVLYLNFAGNKEKNISINGKYIRAYFAVFTDEGNNAEGIILVLQDITEQQKLENMRKEFVANVSHELRTPLTSIKSYTETLLDGALEDRETTERFLDVINSEADRMTRLVKDLLQLSRLDNQQMQWNMQPVSLVNLVKKTVEKMNLEARNKNQLLESYVIGDIPHIKADGDRIEQVVLNIVSNSIKYTPEGGRIIVYTSRLYNDVCLKVSDNGMGIPEKDLPRIFERFYRVDKARSREMGGTGLGLSIAKEIVEAHGGKISINSEYGKGTEVIIKFPIEGSCAG